MKYTSRIVLPLLMLLFQNCSESSQTTGSQSRHFDLAGYFDAQVKTLQGSPRLVEKNIVHDEEVNETLDSISDWKKELELFLNLDLNNPRNGTFESSIDSSGDLSIESLRNTDQGKEIREIKLTRKKGRIELVQIFSVSSNWVRERSTRLSYQPEKGYGVSINEKYIWGKPHNAEIFAQIIDPDLLHR